MSQGCITLCRSPVAMKVLCSSVLVRLSSSAKVQDRRLVCLQRNTWHMYSGYRPCVCVCVSNTCMIIATHLNFILHFNFPTYQVIVQANGFNIVIICPAFEDICWVSEIACLCVCMWKIRCLCTLWLLILTGTNFSKFSEWWETC